MSKPLKQKDDDEALIATDDSWHQGATKVAVTDLTKVTKRSETGDHRKHSWVRKKNYSFRNLAWKSLANHWVNQTMQ